MRLDIYGLGKVYKLNWSKRQGTHLGYFNGEIFVSDKYTIKNLKEYDYLHIYTNQGLKWHIAKRFTKNIEKQLKRIYASEYGTEVQQSLF